MICYENRATPTNTTTQIHQHNNSNPPQNPLKTKQHPLAQQLKSKKHNQNPRNYQHRQPKATNPLAPATKTHQHWQPTIKISPHLNVDAHDQDLNVDAHDSDEHSYLTSTSIDLTLTLMPTSIMIAVDNDDARRDQR